MILQMLKSYILSYSEFIHSKLYTQELLVLYYIGTKHNANSMIDETQANTEINPQSQITIWYQHMLMHTHA